MTRSRFLFSLASLGVCLALVPTNSFGANPTTALVTKIQKSGLGCLDAKLDKSKILYSPTRTICNINGEKTNIEVYSASNFKKATKYLCSSGFDINFLTDKKTWSIVPDTESTMNSIQKIVGGSIVSACSVK
jgi:hypothetical protein